MDGTKCYEQGKKTPFAIRIVEDLPTELNKYLPVFFAPEIGAIVSNFEIYDQTGIRMFKLKPFEIEGMAANHMAEVWGFKNGEPIRLKEKWYFAYFPKDMNPEKFIAEFHELENRRTIEASRLRQAERPSPFFKTEIAKTVDPLENARQATLALFKREYPLLARALDSKESAPEAAKAFIADCVRLTGCIDTEVNLNDAKFVARLADAWQAHDRREVRKSKVDALDWYLAHPRNWTQLYALPMSEIARRVNNATKIELSPGAIEKRLERLELITPRKRGKPAKR